MKKIFAVLKQFTHFPSIQPSRAYDTNNPKKIFDENVLPHMHQLEEAINLLSSQGKRETQLNKQEVLRMQESFSLVKKDLIAAQQSFYLEKLHHALELGDFAAASSYLTPDNLHSKNKYGSTPIILALNEKEWDFLSTAEQLVNKKVEYPSELHSVVNSEHDELT